MTDYSYTPLKDNEIRLLYIDAGETTDPLMCTFHRCVLPPQNIPFTFKYTALSYHWSTEVSMHPISLHGHNFLIPNNLAVALRRLRHKTGGGTILMWVDALCINQADLAEKSLQVVRMRAIYESATRVLCWLGDEDEQSRIACKELTELLTILPREILSRDPSMSLLAQNIPVLHSHLSKNDWVALRSFFMNPWWSRVWVLQEATTKNETWILCGNWALRNIMLLLWVEALAVRISARYANRPNFFVGDAPIYRMRYLKKARNGQMPNELTLLEVLAGFRGLGISDPRDHVYAAINMVVDLRTVDLKPNYFLAVNEVFIGSVEWLFNGTKSVLDVLGYIESRAMDDAHKLSTNEGLIDLSPDSQPKSFPNDLPSWVPNWTAAYTHIPFTKKYQMGNATHTDIYKASGEYSGLKVDIILQKNRKILEIEGFAIDTIKRLSDPGPNMNLMDYATEISWKPSASEASYVTGESMEDAYLRTIVADMTFGNNLDRCRGGKMNWDEHELFGTALKCATFGRRLATTKDGYMGLVRKDVQVGDIVFVLRGGEVLYVLRPQGTYYLFVGECYMHGLMDGEAMERLNDSRAAFQKLEMM